MQHYPASTRSFDITEITHTHGRPQDYFQGWANCGHRGTEVPQWGPVGAPEADDMF